MIYDCSAPVFRNLKNPYTGEKLAVKLLVTKDGRVLFGAPGTYSPASTPAKTSAAAFRLWNRVDGREGLRMGSDDVVKCAWTGKLLVPRSSELGWTLDGGFDPTMFLPREEFLYYATMRDGVATRPPPSDVRVEQPAREAMITRRHRQGVEERAAKLDEDSVRVAERIMKQAGADPSPTVSMHVPRKRGK